jgi:hypothetical protein
MADAPRRFHGAIALEAVADVARNGALIGFGRRQGIELVIAMVCSRACRERRLDHRAKTGDHRDGQG